jgi:hypothetical protein
MTLFLGVLALFFGCGFVVMYFMKRRSDRAFAALQQQTQAAIASTQALFESKLAELDLETQRIRQHYETEARKAQEAANAELTTALTELEPLRGYAHLRDAEQSVRQLSPMHWWRRRHSDRKRSS